jgi:hypothetical protein
MNSLPFPSHRLFVAALSDEDGLRTKPTRETRVINLTDGVRVIPLENADCAPLLRPVAAQPFPERECVPGW